MSGVKAKQAIKEFLINRHEANSVPLHAHASCGTAGLLESYGYDVSMARHGDVARAVVSSGGDWAACHQTALPKKHLQALSALRYGTAPLASNMLHDVPVSGRLCPFCAKGNQAVVEDEMHVCFDCPLHVCKDA